MPMSALQKKANRMLVMDCGLSLQEGRVIDADIMRKDIVTRIPTLIESEVAEELVDILRKTQGMETAREVRECIAGAVHKLTPLDKPTKKNEEEGGTAARVKQPA